MHQNTSTLPLLLTARRDEAYNVRDVPSRASESTYICDCSCSKPPTQVKWVYSRQMGCSWSYKYTLPNETIATLQTIIAGTFACRGMLPFAVIRPSQSRPSSCSNPAARTSTQKSARHSCSCGTSGAICASRVVCVYHSEAPYLPRSGSRAVVIHEHIIVRRKVSGE